MEYWLFMRVLSRRKWLIIGLILLTLIATYISILVFPVPLEARTSILFNFQTPGDVEVFDTNKYQGPGEAVEHYNFVALFKSESVLKEAYENAASEVDLGPVTLEILRKQGKAALSLIKVGGLDEKTSIIEYVVTLRNPKRAIALCNAVTEVAIERYKEILADATVKSREYFSQQVIIARVELENSQKVLETFYLENPEFTRYLDRATYSGETIRSESNIIDLQIKNASLGTQIKSIEADIREYTDNPADKMPVSIQANVLINDLRTQLVKHQLEKEKLLKRYSEDYPSVMKLNRDIVETRNSLYSTYLTLLSEQLTKYKLERSEITASLSSMEFLQNETILDYNKFSVKRLIYNGFDRDLNVAENNYRLMVEKHTEAKIREDEVRNRYTLAIIDKPNEAMPKDEFYHNPAFKMVFALFGSLLFSLLLVFMMDYFEVRYRATTDISTIIDLPILGEIPEFRVKK